MPTVHLTDKQYEDLRRRGVKLPAPAGKAKGRGKRGKPALLPFRIDATHAGRARRLVIELPVRTVSEANQRAWRERSNRTREARAVVSRCLGPHLRTLAAYAEHYHGGGVLKVTFTRVGGSPIDAMANLGASLKHCEDALCLLLGTDDGDKRWQAAAEQAAGKAVGVRIELECVGAS